MYISYMPNTESLDLCAFYDMLYDKYVNSRTLNNTGKTLQPVGV